MLLGNLANPYLRMDLERLCDRCTQQVIDALQSNPNVLQRLMNGIDGERKRRFVPVTPGRKPLWAKLQEEEYMNLELLARAGLGSPEEIFHNIKRECARQQSIAREPAIPRNIFREFYYKVMSAQAD